ncbi:hypothetical protein [Saccharopolyspora pogona]|uniref:hypothetical protein n=1 Tax=Saccharopolyspora pogona TaxID=333966 RepID=UPI001689640D|nr:hypothetical protein [Saccharopolyspora pogona]
MLAADVRVEVAQRLWGAERDRVLIPPLVETTPQLDAVDAYEIQLLSVCRRDEPVVGHKFGLTSVVMQQMMGVSEPDYGHLVASMRLPEGEPVDPRRYCVPRVRSRSGSCSARTCPRSAPSRTCWPEPRRWCRRSS